jgi:hypothetical protein
MANVAFAAFIFMQLAGAGRGADRDHRLRLCRAEAADANCARAIASSPSTASLHAWDDFNSGSCARPAPAQGHRRRAT